MGQGQSIEVYHYTSEYNMKQIQSSGYIHESPLSNKDAFYGRGVYLTTLSPAEGRRKISENNWGQYGSDMEEMGKADHAIKLWIPEGKLKRARSGDRDIWVHPGDVVISNYSHTFFVEGQEESGSWCAIL